MRQGVAVFYGDDLKIQILTTSRMIGVPKKKKQAKKTKNKNKTK